MEVERGIAGVCLCVWVGGSLLWVGRAEAGDY